MRAHPAHAIASPGSIVAAIAVSALAIYVVIVARRVRKLEQDRDVERRHREHLTAQVERLEDRAAGVSPKPEDETVGVVVKLGPRSPE